jgi:hypothetical protein
MFNSLGRHITGHWRGQLSLPMSFWVNGVVVSWPFIASFTIMERVYSASELYPAPVAIGMLVLLIVYLAVLTWQTMGVFRCGRRVGGFWSIVVIVVFGVVWLGEIVPSFDVLLPLGVVLIIWFLAIAMVAFVRRTQPADALTRQA